MLGNARVETVFLLQTSASLFAPDAIRAIASASDGVPRNVNTICFNSLTLAYALNHGRVGREEVAEALRDLDLAVNDSLTQNASAPKPAPAPFPHSIGAFAQASRSLRPAFIAATVVLLAAGTLLFQSLSGAF